MCCVTRARTGTLCTSESGFSWISCILDPGFLCIVPIHCSVSLGAAGSWERQIWMHSVPFFRRGVCGQNLGFFRGRPSLSSPTCPLALFYQHIRLITTVDTMSEEKRCDRCYTSAESNRAETMEWRGVKRTKRGHGQGAQYLTNTFLLRKFDQHRDRECLEPPENERFQIIWRSNQNWNWDSPLTATCVSTRRGLSIEAIPNDWVVDTGRSTPALGADDHIWASSSRGLLRFYNYHAPAGMDCVGLLRW